LAIEIHLLAFYAGEKEKGGRGGPARPCGLEGGYVRGLQALGATGNLEFNRLPFVERLIPVSLDGGEVHKNVLAGLALDEPIPFAGVEPLHSSLFFHGFSSSLFDLVTSAVRLLHL
jgi:hypothetical protein